MAGRRPGPTTPHGHYARAKRHGCRCAPCVDAYKAYNRDRYKRHLMGVNTLVDAAPVRNHLEQLVAAGMTPMQIEAATDHRVNRTQIKQILGIHPGRRPTVKVRPTTARLLMAVRRTDHITSGAGVDPTGTRRRLQALVAIGWEQTHLADRLGRSFENLHGTMHRATFVRASTATAVRALYNELSMTPGPSRRARLRAERRGWAPPLAWDDDAIDDPTAVPDCGATTTRVAALVEDADELARVEGLDLAAIAERLGVTKSAIEHARRREAAA